MPVIRLPEGTSTLATSLGIHAFRDDPTFSPEILWRRANIYDDYLMYMISPAIPFVPNDGLGWDYFEVVECLYSIIGYWHTFNESNNEGGREILGRINISPLSNHVGTPELPCNYFRTTSFSYPYPPAPVGIFSQLYRYDSFYAPLKVEYFRGRPIDTATLNLNKPNYRSLVSGYELDSRSVPNFPQIVSPIDKTIKISYYRWNRLENIPNLKSICWMVYECQLIKDVPYILPIEDCMLGSLNCSDATALALVISLPNIAGKYKWRDLTFTAIPSLFTDWYALYDATNTNPDNLPIFPEIRLLRKIAANNDIWNNANLGVDINPDLNHPMFAIDEELAYFNHLMPTVDGPGNASMEGPHTKEIHAAFNCGFYARDPETNLPRVANLGHLTERIASLLGYRPEPNGTFKKEKELTKIRTIVSGSQPLDPTKVGVNNFAKESMIVRRLNNRFEGNGIRADECVVVHDVIQLLAEYQDQLNLALNLQESSAIEIKGKDGTARYPNQLSLMTELLNLATANQEMIRAALVSSLVAQGQTSELIAALGLPSVTKSLPIQIGDKTEQLPYTGVAPHRSISQEIATCTQMTGIILGQLI